PVLVFREWHALAAGDQLRAEISTNGTTWTTLATFNGFSTSSPPGTSSNAGDLWLLDLKAYEGQTAQVRFRLSGYRVQMDGALAAVSFIFNVLPKTGPEMDFGSGRATAVLLRTESGWKLQRLHTS
ncbi:MAG: hypothetical protein E4H19_01435, partial [Chromatiales bacterium]